MKYWIVAFVLLSSGAWADDCKPAAEALAKTATVPNHAVIVTRTLGTYEDIHTRDAAYSNYGGIWKPIPYNDAEQATRLADGFQNKKADCTLRGAETLNGEAVQHYTATEHLKRGDVFNEFWISNATGLILKSYLTFKDDDITETYDYTNIKAPL